MRIKSKEGDTALKIGIVSFVENQEIKKLEDVFLANEYPLKRIQPALETSKSTPPEKETDLRKLVLPYIKGLSEKITQVCQKLDVPTAFTSQHPHPCKTEDKTRRQNGCNVQDSL